MKRITLFLDDALLSEIRRLADREGKEPFEIVNSLLRDGLELRERWIRTEFELPSFPMGKASVKLADRNVIQALM